MATGSSRASWNNDLSHSVIRDYYDLASTNTDYTHKPPVIIPTYNLPRTSFSPLFHRPPGPLQRTHLYPQVRQHCITLSRDCQKRHPHPEPLGPALLKRMLLVILISSIHPSLSPTPNRRPISVSRVTEVLGDCEEFISFYLIILFYISISSG